MASRESGDPPNTRPMVSEGEVDDLAALYGRPVRRHFCIDLDDYLLDMRARRRGDRRAEVLFAVTRPSGRVLIHSKPRYPQGVYRLFTGGINPDESVVDALFREVAEETGLACRVERFLAVCTYAFHHPDPVRRYCFASYMFHLVIKDEDVPAPRDLTEIGQIGEIALEGLPAIASHLRSLQGNRAAWGIWRAIGHDIVYEQLTQQSSMRLQAAAA